MDHCQQNGEINVYFMIENLLYALSWHRINDFKTLSIHQNVMGNLIFFVK